MSAYDEWCAANPVMMPTTSEAFEAGRQSVLETLPKLADDYREAGRQSVLSEGGDTSWVLDEMKELAETAGEPHLFDVVSDQESWNDAVAGLHHAVERLRSSVSGQQGVLVPRDLLERLKNDASELAGSLTEFPDMHEEVLGDYKAAYALLSRSVAEEADRG